jgi:hypothetical protein
MDWGCRKPKELCLAAELWTLSALAVYVRCHAVPAGHPCLSSAGKSTVWRILEGGKIKPHRVRYSLERRDTDFERKRAEVWGAQCQPVPTRGHERSPSAVLRHIRVSSLDELRSRIFQEIDEMNAQPVRFQWENFNFQMT